VDELRLTLYERLRRAPAPATVPGTLPVLFFGDLFQAEVATVGLNPSDQEYLTKAGQMLAGPAQRFATLASLAATDRASLTDAQCDEAIEWMRDYYDAGKPVYGSWFNALSRVVDGFGASFRERTAAHLDLVQESTSPVWSELPPAERDALLEQDLPFLAWEIRTFEIKAVICTAKTVSVHVRNELSVDVDEEGTLARIKWWVGHADVDGRPVGFAGWNYPLARATGLGAAGERELGQLLAAKLGLTGAAPPLSPAATPPPAAVLDRDENDAVVSLTTETGSAPSASSAQVPAGSGSRLKGLTHPVWDGVSLPTLRYWLRWWQDESKSAGRVENGWGRDEQIERISAEIAAREAAGLGKRTTHSDPPARVTADAPVVGAAEVPAAANVVLPTLAVAQARSDRATDAVRAAAATRRRLYREPETRDDLFAIVEQRRDQVRDYLQWAKDSDNEQWTHRMHARPDIARAAEAAALFADDWWGVVVYSCFDSTIGARTVAPHFQQPLPSPEAERLLATVDFPRGSVGGHRIQPTVKGARQALVAACADHELLYELLHSGDDFDTRYLLLRAAKLRQWGRTTSYDLLLRAGALGIGGQRYKPEYAYLGGSSGPKSGFATVFGETPNTDERVAWAEALLWHWTQNWKSVAEIVGVDWERAPLEPSDQENFLCIYQERR
jgi:hypothetical protein